MQVSNHVRLSQNNSHCLRTHSYHNSHFPEWGGHFVICHEVPLGSNHPLPAAIIQTRFQARPLKFIHVFRPGLQTEIILSLLRLGRKRKNYSNLFGIRIFLLLSYSFGIVTMKMFRHSRSSLENPTRFQTKMGKVYIRFQTKTAQKPYPMGRHIPIWFI